MKKRMSKKYSSSLSEQVCKICRGLYLAEVIINIDYHASRYYKAYVKKLLARVRAVACSYVLMKSLIVKWFLTEAQP